MYGLMEAHPHAERMQMEMIRETEQVRPKYIVVVNVGSSWLIRPQSSQKILDWGESYVKSGYHQVGLIDIINPSTTRYLWEAKAADYRSVSRSNITVFERN